MIAIALLVFACLAVWLAREQERPVESLVMLALAGLLVSPVSWTHHWVWIAPLVIALLVRARSPQVAAALMAKTLAAVWIFAVGLRLIWIVDDTQTVVAPYYGMFGTNAYIVLGTLSLLFFGWSAMRPRVKSAAVTTPGVVGWPGDGAP